ncbi:MAG: methyltransferase domain-containing protein [Bowdeniella nasicola]|nr:methyltransferase domain-containing protein [Bowdeniella nasicola]
MLAVERARNRWDGDVPAAYDRSFAHMCAGVSQAVLAHANPGTLIDAGCGTGLFAARAHAGGWRVRAFDSDSTMVARARARGIAATCDRLPHLGEVANWRGATVVANFVIQHLSAPVAALTSLAQLIEPAATGDPGRLIVTSWPPIWLAHRAVWMEVFADLAAAPVPHDAPACDTSPDGLAAALSAVGLRVVTAELVRWDWQIHWQAYLTGVQAGIAYIGKRFRAQDRALRREIVAQVCHRMRRFGAPEVMTLPCIATLVVGEGAARA